MKRLFDLAVTLAFSPLWVPLLFILMLVVVVAHGWSPLFTQKRGGFQGKVIEIYKLRSMTNERDATGQLLPDEKRLTRVGRLIRASSLDELPGLFNVLKGDMSLVGPRPLIADYLPLYNAEQARRHEVRPGITGWAQVNGRNALSWEEKFAYDVWYVDHRGFWLDIRILLLTVKKVLLREGINSGDDATMPRFTGSMQSKQPL